MCAYVSTIRESGYVLAGARIEIPGALDDVRVRGTNLLEVSWMRPGEPCRAARTSCCRQVTDVARIKCRKMVGRVWRVPLSFPVAHWISTWIPERVDGSIVAIIPDVSKRLDYCDTPARDPRRKNRTSHQNKHKSNSARTFASVNRHFSETHEPHQSHRTNFLSMWFL